MKNSVKGALYSGLVFPGAGQVVLKQYRRGVALIVLTAACMAAVIRKALQEAFAVLDMLESGGRAADMGAISDAANSAVTSSDSHLIQILLFLILLCWIFGIVDAYRTGRHIDSKIILDKYLKEDES